MNAFLLLLATAVLQAATLSVEQHKDDFPFESNSKENSIRIEEKNFVIYNRTRYYFSLLDASLYEAQVTCEEFGMELVSFETKVKSDTLWEYIQAENINKFYHTSGVKVSANWKWSSTYLNYVNWASGEPDETSTTNQACIYYGNGLFYDDNCDSSRSFICQDKFVCDC